MFLIVVAVVLFLLSYYHLIYSVLLIGYLVFLYKQDKKLWIIVILLSSLLLTKLIYYENKKPLTETNFIGTVIDIDHGQYTNRVLLHINRDKVIMYTKDNLEVGMIVYVQSQIIEVEGNRIENSFNYQSYLKYNHIRGVVYADEVDVLDKKFIVPSLAYNISNYFDNQFTGEAKVFLRAFLLGDTSLFSHEFYESIRHNGIVHLFAISGLHIYFFVSMLAYVLLKLTKSQVTTNSIICLFLTCYLIATYFSPSILRASLMFLVGIINKGCRFRWSSCDVASITFIGLIVANPYYMYQMGFVLSFTVCFVIILTSQLIKHQSSILQTLIISTAAQLVTLPIIIAMQYRINVLSPITNVLYLYWVQLIILPASICTLVLPFLEPLYEALMFVFANSSLILSNYCTIPLKIGKMSPYTIITYYGLLLLIVRFYSVRRYRNILMGLLICFIAILSNAIGINKDGNIYFLDLYYGESIVIVEPFGTCRAVIDTGDGRNDEVTRFLQSKGIHTLDLLILTHNHLDHNGEAQKIADVFNPSQIVMSHYDTFNIVSDNIIRVDEGDKISCGKLRFFIVHPDRLYQNENDNSLVIHTYIGNKWFLFTGDATQSVEDKWKEMPVDVLKVGHHGSKTSSSLDFLMGTRPSYAIIQAGRVSQFGFPHQETINRLEKAGVAIYRTDRHYSITYRYNKKQQHFYVLHPG